jgi:hypothetical protein
MVAVLMIAEIVSNGMLSLPSSLAVVGIVPGLILIIFLGVFATYTSWLLVKFKMRHPSVHNMGDAGLILFGPIGREVLAFGTIVFAVFATGGQLLAGQFAISALSNESICPLLGNGEHRFNDRKEYEPMLTKFQASTPCLRSQCLSRGHSTTCRGSALQAASLSWSLVS